MLFNSIFAFIIPLLTVFSILVLTRFSSVLFTSTKLLSVFLYFGFFINFVLFFCPTSVVLAASDSILELDNAATGVAGVFKKSIFVSIITIIIPVLLSVAFFTLAERQVMASMQRRMGPNVSGFGGLLQPFYDGLKLGVKEPVLPEQSTSGLFTAAPVIGFVLSQVSFCTLFLSDSNFQGLILMALSSLGVYSVLLAGYGSNSKYAFLGCLRSVALMVSYELGFGAALLSICFFLTDSTGNRSLNFAEASPSVQFALLPLFIIFCICILAETKRVPFDLPESESELVAGYNVEYSSLGFALFFIAEYSNMAVMAGLASCYFLGGFSAVKLTVLFFGFVWVRATLPRYRYDQFMQIGWKALLPLSLALFSMYASFDFIF